MNQNIKISLTELLRYAVRIESINPPGKEKPMCDFVYEYMNAFCDETIKIPLEKDRYDIIAVIKGKNSDHPILFTGHMDVVPVSTEEKKRWKTDPFSGEVMDDYLYGRGSSDMKSGLVCAMAAMKEIKNRHITPPQDVLFVATVDEEGDMRGSKAAAGHPSIQHATRIVVCEPTNLICCTVGKGRTYGTLKIRGKTGHGSHFDENNNAILLTHRVIEEMRHTEFPSTEYGETFWQPLRIFAGVEPCVVPDVCELKVDARIAPGLSTDDIWDEMERILQKIKRDIPTFDAELSVIDRREPWIDTDNAWIERIGQSYEKFQFPFHTGIFQGTTDGTVLRQNKKNVVIVGPGDLSCVHRENERVYLPDVVCAFTLYLDWMTME